MDSGLANFSHTAHDNPEYSLRIIEDQSHESKEIIAGTAEVGAHKKMC